VRTEGKIGLITSLGTFGLAFGLSQTIAKKKLALPVAEAAELPIEASWKAISAVTPVKGRVQAPWVKDVTEDVSYGKGEFPASIPLPHKVEAGALCVNDSADTISAKLTAWFVDPDGKERAKTERTADIDPGKGKPATTKPIALDKEGTWTFHVKMEPA